MSQDYSIETKCVQAGYRPGNGEPRQIPVIQSTTFRYDTSADMGKLFDLEDEGYFYTRLQNAVAEGWLFDTDKFASVDTATIPQSPLVYGSDPSVRSWCSFNFSNHFLAVGKRL